MLFPPKNGFDKRLEQLPWKGLISSTYISCSDVVLALSVEYTDCLGVNGSAESDIPGLEEAHTESRNRLASAFRMISTLSGVNPLLFFLIETFYQQVY